MVRPAALAVLLGFLASLAHVASCVSMGPDDLPGIAEDTTCTVPESAHPGSKQIGDSGIVWDDLG